MQCPNCGSTIASLSGRCPHCGYIYERTVSGKLPRQIKLTTPLDLAAPSPGWTLMRGDVIRQGRYRLVEEVSLPRNQQYQGSAWLAVDMQAGRSRVLMHRLAFINGAPEREQPAVEAMIKRLSVLSTHPGLPAITDAFWEKGACYVVQRHPLGESLSSLMRQQGGGLPERDVAEYGRQLCDMLSILAHQQPPIVHGSISMETIIVSADKQHVSLIYLPLLPPVKARQDTDQATRYLAPEQARGGDVQPSSDLYSVAAIMHHAVTGFDPHERMAFFYPPARRLNPLVSAGMEAILTRQLRFSVSQRYTQPEELQQDLTVLIASYPLGEHTPLPTSNTIPPQFARTRSAGKKMAITAVPIAVILCLLVLLIPLFSSGVLTLNGAPNLGATGTAQASLNQAALSKQQALELRSFQAKGIGLSDGRLVFDTYSGRTDTNLKKQAATAIQQGNTSAAVNLLNQAVNADPNDGEAQIYNENLHILQNNNPYVTLALGMPIDGSAAYLGDDREQLEAAYLVQHEANSKNLLPHGLKLRIIIANSGSNDADVATVAQFIADRVLKAANLDHLIGTVGWYDSAQTINARDIIASAHLPLVAPTASSVKLSGSSPYFFRVAPSDSLQGQVLGTLLAKQLKAKKVLILRDPTDSYSVSLANAVASRVEALGSSFTTGVFTAETTTVDQYQQLIESNINSDTPADIIMLAGYQVDGIRLSHAIGNLSRLAPFDTRLSQLKVVGGDAMDSTLLLGDGNSAEAQIARSYPQDIRRLIFTTFADFNEWNFLKIPQSKQPMFFNDWKQTYQSSMVSTNAPDPTYNGLMIYDSMGVYIDAAKQIQEAITGDGMRNVFASLGKGKVPAYQGLSGRVMFDDKGDPVSKALVILTVQQGQNGNAIVIQQVLGTFS
jgi:ABC-type branched-subunit amino acid transport system substrate-binding protein